MLAASVVDDLVEVGHAHGLDAIGVARAEPFDGTLAILEQRKSEGLHGGMAFTYRNPARSADPTRALPNAQSLVVAAKGYLQSNPVEPEGLHARAARYVWDDHYQQLTAGLEAIAEHLRADGWRTRVLVDDNALVDREAAYRAGLGWYGKNSNLLLPGQGSWFVLGSLLTNAPLPASEQPVPDGCGTCTRCIDDCPTSAIVAPGVVDARRCLAWLVQDSGEFPVEFRRALGDRLYGCDDCQEVCPPNRAFERRAVRGDALPAARDAAVWFDLHHVLGASDEELLATYGRWYIAKRDPNYLRRNALVVLANIGHADLAASRELVLIHLRHDSPIVRAHAVWAAGELGLLDILDALRADPDAMVQAELARWPSKDAEAE